MGVRLEHVALWVQDLERMRAFYEEQLGGRAGQRYANPRTGFSSYFVSFDGGARLELMSADDVRSAKRAERTAGYAHVALSVGDRAAVDATVSTLDRAGSVIVGRPRVTGDGYYEAVALDPEGNRIEIVTSAS